MAYNFLSIDIEDVTSLCTNRYTEGSNVTHRCVQCDLLEEVAGNEVRVHANGIYRSCRPAWLRRGSPAVVRLANECVGVGVMEIEGTVH